MIIFLHQRYANIYRICNVVATCKGSRNLALLIISKDTRRLLSVLAKCNRYTNLDVSTFTGSSPGLKTCLELNYEGNSSKPGMVHFSTSDIGSKNICHLGLIQMSNKYETSDWLYTYDKDIITLF
jgi:hypothetical protein